MTGLIILSLMVMGLFVIANDDPPLEDLQEKLQVSSDHYWGETPD